MKFIVKGNIKIEIVRCVNIKLFFVVRNMEEVIKRSGKRIEMNCFLRVSKLEGRWNVVVFFIRFVKLYDFLNDVFLLFR